MDTFEVSLSTMKQYTARGDGPVIALEDEKFIHVYVIVDGYQFCYKHVKDSAERTAVFKQEYLNNPRVVFPIRKIKDQSTIRLSVDPEERDPVDSSSVPEVYEEQEVISLVEEDNNTASSPSQSQDAEEVTMLSTDTHVVG